MISSDGGEMTKDDLRIAICRLAGTNDGNATVLSKKTLNSVYAYLTGEFRARPGELYSEKSPEIIEMKHSVAGVCGLAEYVDRVVDVDKGFAEDRPFRRGELRKILETMEETGDQRDWTQQG